MKAAISCVLCGQDPAQLWQFYIQLVEIEATLKTMKDDLNLRPIYHQCEQRIEAHILACSSDCSMFGRVAGRRRLDTRRLGVWTTVSFNNIHSDWDAIVPAMPMAA